MLSLKGTNVRTKSMRVDDSMRTTVAPWSASALPVSGPTATQLKSATFRPLNASPGRSDRRRQAPSLGGIPAARPSTVVLV